MRSAMRQLCRKGIEALKPQRVPSKAMKEGLPYREAETWRKPFISKRVAKGLRKRALREGTYGSFDADAGVGWDPQWDLVVLANQFSAERFGRIRPQKKTKRERTREERAQKLEEQLESQEEKMEEYYTGKEALRVKDNSFEAQFKRISNQGGRG